MPFIFIEAIVNFLQVFKDVCQIPGHFIEDFRLLKDSRALGVSEVL